MLKTDEKYQALFTPLEDWQRGNQKPHRHVSYGRHPPVRLV